MNRFMMALAIAWLTICSPACAQKSTVGTKSKEPVVNKAVAKSDSASTKNESHALTSKANAAEMTDKEESAAKVSKNTGKPALTADQEKEIKALARQSVKAFAKAELTSEQQEQANEIFGKAAKDYVVKRSKAEITDELRKKQSEGLKEARAAGKSVKEQSELAFASAGFTEDQIKVYKATEASLKKAKREFSKSLSEEQIARLPKQLQSLISAK